MPDLTTELLPHVRSTHLPQLALEPGLLPAHTQGLSILNMPATVCRWLGAPDLGAPRSGAPPLASAVLAHLGAGKSAAFERVVLVLMDALSHRRLRSWLQAGELPFWSALAQDGVLAPLTSIVPSTTSAALTSLWTGRAAAEHGAVGYELWLKEYGVVANMITHSPFSFQEDTGGLARAGFRPEAFLSTPTLGPHLRSHGVAVHAFQHHSIARSGLSRMNLAGAEMHPVRTASDMWIGVRRLLEQEQGERLFVWAYWDAVDTLAHLHGPGDERPKAEFAHFSAALERSFFKALSPSARRATLLVLLADHGQVFTPKTPHYDLRHHPGLTRRLHLMPTGENRLAYLFVRPGQTGAVREYIERTWPQQFQVLDAAYAAHAGLFGGGPRHPRLLDRLGDLLVVSLGEAYLWWGVGENPIVGRHGGLAEDEMLVPLLAAPL